ncbi:MAG: LysR family transcriptional regulator [Burkholderiales bacterium]|nr:LysR family transcriptional regulator [Burkholderiales bacterium]
MIQFRQIEAFRCLMLTGTSVGAARKMHITQPAISRLIADLETELGFSLFNRAKGRLEPTVAGVRFYKAVEENFLGLERLAQVAGTIRNDAPEGLTIACLPVLSTTILPLVLRQFFLSHPEIPVAIETCSLTEMLMGLQDHKIDLALSLDFPPVAGVEVEPVMQTRVFCAMPKDHRLSRKAVIEPADFAGESVIGWLSSNSVQYEGELEFLHNAGVRPRYTVKTNTSHTRYAMVAHGLGISIVEPFAAKIWRAHGVVVRPIVSDIRYQYVLAYPSSSKETDLLQDFRRAVLQVAGEYDFGH